MRFSVVLYCATLACSATCLASDKQKFYAAHDETCKQYLIDRSASATTLPHVAWVSGYITAYNRQTPDTYDIANGRKSSDFIPWLDRWCQSNPNQSLAGGMKSLTSEIAASRRRSK